MNEKIGNRNAEICGISIAIRDRMNAFHILNCK